MKTLQKFTDEYLEHCKSLSPQQIIQFLEDFRQLQNASLEGKSILISLKVNESLLRAFRMKADANHLSYQTQIKNLMRNWLKD